jgi:hypothetical protein
VVKAPRFPHASCKSRADMPIFGDQADVTNARNSASATTIDPFNTKIT